MQQLGFFPTPYPDECFYSVFCRYYVRSGISSSESVTKKFFGYGRSLLVSTIYFPRKFERLSYWVDPDSGITVKKLICNHTSYPYQSISYADDLYQQMEEVLQNGIPETGIEDLTRRMMSKSRYAAAGQYLRFCPECAREDIWKYGETYWHRLPQFPGIKYCPEHSCPIQNSDAPFEAMRVRIYPASYALRNVKVVSKKENQRYREKYLSIARETAWLLEYGREFGGHREISRKYRECMKERGYANFHGICNREEVKNDFMEEFGDGYLTELFPHNDDPVYWLRYLQESIGFNLLPLHHILLMKFFAGSAKNFLNSEVKSGLPYGDGMWPCINKICSHYLKDSSKRSDIRKMGKDVWAWFECPYCGMRYRRSRPDQPFEEYLKNPCISDRGFLYEERLKEYLSDTGMSMPTIAGKLGVGSSTVYKYVKNNSIDISDRYRASYYSCKNDDEDKTTFYHRRVLEELQKTPVMSCKDLKEHVPGAYEWLIQNEPAWIHDKLIREIDKPRWQEWGEAALAELKAAYKEIQASGSHKKRISIGWLARVAGLNRDDITGRLSNLPKMKKFFDDVCESKEEWIRRRYTEVALDKRKAGGKEFTYDDVKRKVNIRRNTYDRNRKLIEELIRVKAKSKQFGLADRANSHPSQRKT